MTGTRIELCGPLSVVLDGEPREGALRSARGGCCSPISCSTATARSGATSSPTCCGPRRHARGRRGAAGAAAVAAAARAGRGRLVGRGELRLVLGEDAEVDWELAHGALARARACARRPGDAADAPEAAAEAGAIAAGGLLPGARGGLDRRAPGGARRPAARGARAARGRRDPARRGPRCRTPSAPRATAVELAPFRESARAALMEVLAARGNPAEALRAFEDVRVLLREELGSSPGPRSSALHERLLRE